MGLTTAPVNRHLPTCTYQLIRPCLCAREVGIAVPIYEEETEAQRGVVTCLRPPSWRGGCRSAPKAWLSSRCRAQEPHPELPTQGAELAPQQGGEQG